MKLRPERFDLRHQRGDQPLRRAIGHAGDIVDRFLRIKLGALSADLVKNVDQVRLHIEQAQLEHREQPARPGPDDKHVGLDRFAHVNLLDVIVPSHRAAALAAAFTPARRSAMGGAVSTRVPPCKSKPNRTRHPRGWRTSRAAAPIPSGSPTATRRAVTLRAYGGPAAWAGPVAWDHRLRRLPPRP